MNRTLALACIVISCAIESAHAVRLDVIPANPRYMEPVVLRITPTAAEGTVIYGATVSVQGHAMVVTMYSYPGSANASHDVSLGQLPAGTYGVALERADTPGAFGAVTFTVAAAPVPGRVSLGGPPVPSVNFSGQWWNPAEPGWGLALTQGPTNVVFGEWLVYDQTGRPIWYTLGPGSWTAAESPMTYIAPIYGSTGPYWAGPTSASSSQSVGTGTLRFSDAFNGTLEFMVEGIQTTKPIARLPID